MGHNRRWAGAVIRLAGAILLAVAWLAGARLFAAPDGWEAVLAAVLFTSASAGSAMLVLGAHLFDQVAVSRRWAPIESVILNSFQDPPEGQAQDARWMLKQVQHDEA